MNSFVVLTILTYLTGYVNRFWIGEKPASDAETGAPRQVATRRGVIGEVGRDVTGEGKSET